MTAPEIISELKKMGSAQIKTILMKHGAKEPIIGVRIGDMKPIQKKIKKDHSLSLELYNSGIYDAMYLAGLIADEAKMTKKEIHDWAKKSKCVGISEYTVAWVAAESPFGWELGNEWINSGNELIASSGWSTLAGWLALKPDSELDIDAIRKLIKRIETEIHSAPNHVRYVMNNFIICAGTYVQALTEECIKSAKKIGVVTVDMGDTACEVPAAIGYIEKIRSKGGIGKKRKTVKC